MRKRTTPHAEDSDFEWCCGGEEGQGGHSNVNNRPQIFSANDHWIGIVVVTHFHHRLDRIIEKFWILERQRPPVVVFVDFSEEG